VRYRPFRARGILPKIVGTLARIERQSEVLPQPRYQPFWQRDRRLRRLGAAGLPPALDVLPAGGRLVVVKTAAAYVETSKLSTPDDLRFRAFYGETTPVTLKAAWETPSKPSRIGREVSARTQLPALQRLRIPELHDHGQHDTIGFLVEAMVPGVVPAREEQPDHVDHVLSGVEELYLATAREQARSGLAGSAAWDRARAFLSETRWARGWLPRQTLLQAATDLVHADPPLAAAMTHGDLVWSNILIDDDRIGLVDWEWAGPRPVASDIAKLLAPVPDRLRLIGRLDELSRQLGVHTPFAAQWALALVRSAASATHRIEVAKAAGRENAAIGRARKQVGMLSEQLRFLGH